ncbi:disks large-associated protein 4 [Condylostylus longicornis]|uniref:disks large-associated protein 4 n=1 Tax=Condylostylus longicornis TaxID=2530218 RepID=UPI00244D9ED2|nr:disks large-associated protein 4 [Condylostylus longicornis]
MDEVNSTKYGKEKANNNSEIKNIYKIPDNYSTLHSMSEIKKCVEKISSLQKVLKDSSSNSRSSFDQVDRSININSIVPQGFTKDTNDIVITTEQNADGKHFLEILKSEQNRLIEKAEELEADIIILSQDEKKYEEVLGLLRSASGKSRLLVSQKMTQFEGLCHNNINQAPSEKFQTTNEDLQGFWDMVKLQIDHVDSLFKEIQTLKNNKWILKTNSISEEDDNTNLVKLSTKKSTKSQGLRAKKSDKLLQDINGTKKEDARRKELLELKRRAKNAMQNQETQKPSDSNTLEFFF